MMVQTKKKLPPRNDPVAWIEGTLINPETGKRFQLLPDQGRVLRMALTPGPDGDLPYRDILYSAIKKSGKSTFGAICMIYVICALGGRFAEGYVLANDYEQAKSRIFTMCVRIVEASPMLRAKIVSDTIMFSNGATIQAISGNYKSAAGSAPTFIIADELWAFTTEGSQRVYAECTTTPTRKPSARMVVSYAGILGESELLERLVKRALQGNEVEPNVYVQPGMFAFISHGPIAPWQTQEWIDEQRASMRPADFMRQMLNEFTAGETGFIDMDLYDLCVDPDLKPCIQDQSMPVYIGIDASTKRDSTAIAVCTSDRQSGRVRLVNHQIFQPTPDDPLNFELTIERFLLACKSRYAVKKVFYDPSQMASTSQRLVLSGLPMQEYLQTPSNLLDMGQNLYDLISKRQIDFYHAPEIRLAMSRAVARESSRGWSIGKAKQSHKIDIVIATAMAALAALQAATQRDSFEEAMTWNDMRRHPEKYPAMQEIAARVTERELEVHRRNLQTRLCGSCKLPIGPGTHIAEGEKVYHVVCPKTETEIAANERNALRELPPRTFPEGREAAIRRRTSKNDDAPKDEVALLEERKWTN